MLRSITFMTAGVALGLLLAASPATAAKKPLPCGDYDGAPSHNDCRPLDPDHKARCDKILDKIEADFGLNPDTSDPKYIRLKKKYKKCVFASH